MARTFTNCVLTFIAFLALTQNIFAQTINAGADITRCNGQTNATLGATDPGPRFSGRWSFVSGPTTGNFSNVNAINSTFTPATSPNNTTASYVLRWTVDPGLVISQIYTDGGNSGATYLNDFVELHNRSSSAISLTGRTLQYSSATGNFATIVALSGTIPAGGFFLIQLASAGANGVALPTANLTSSSINMSSAAGKIALVNQTTALNCSACTPAQEALIIDMVSWGIVNGSNTETNTLTALGATNSARRNPIATACTDTNNNANDFTIGSVLNNVRNSSTPVQTCTALGFDDVSVNFVNIATTNTVTENSGTANDGTISCGASATISPAGNGSAYSWSSSPAGFTSSSQNITVNPLVTTTYTCTITSTGGCTATTSRTINVTAITASTTVSETSGTTSNDGTICNGASVMITALGGVSYLWGANAGNSANQTITVSPTANTTYICTVTDANGCTAAVSRVITVNALPTVNTTVAETSAGASNDGTFCFGANGTMTAISAGATFLWSPATFLSSTSVANPTVTAITATTTYTVTATNAGCTNTATRTLTVLSPPNISINVTENSGIPNDATVCLGSSATMTASGANTYSWSPAATLNVTTGATVIASPSVTTTYTVTATDGNQCSATRTQQISVPLGNPLTVTETSGVANDNTLCPNASATISASGGASYLWSANAGNSISSTITVSPTSPVNVYSCTITDALGCASIVMTTVNVDIIPAAIALVENSGIANDGNICLGGSATLNASGGGTYSWSSSPTGLSSAATSVTVTPTITTTYVVTVTNPTTGCIATASRKLTVQNIPSASTTVTESSGIPNNNTICIGGSATLAVPNVANNQYSWTSVPAGFTAQLASVNVNPTLTTTYNVTVTNPIGCTAVNSVTVTIENPSTNVTVTEVSNFGNSATDGILCQGGTATLTAVTGQGTYSWVSPYGESSNTNTFTVSPTITTTYTLTVTSPNGCTAVRQVVVTVTDPPLALITATEDSGTSNDNIICNGTSAVLTAIDGYDAYSWRSSPTGLNSAATTVNVSPTATTTYLLTVTNDGCSSSSSTLITVLPRPTAPISVTETSGTANDGRVCFGTPTTLTISGGVSYIWDQLNAGGSVDATVNVTPTATTTYSCTVTGTNGCTGVSTFTVTVTPTVNINVVENSGGNPNDGIICAGGATTLTASGASQYLWRSNPAGTNATTASISVAPTVTTTYLLTATDNATGCVATLSRTIDVLVVPPQIIDIAEFSGVTNDGKICAGSTVNLYGPANGVAYVWTSVPAGLNSTFGNLVVSPSVTTTYNVTVTNAFGCTAVANRIITVNPVITLTETSGTANDGRVCLGTNVTLNATTASAGSGPVTYQWSSIPAGFTSNLASITVSPTATTIYTVTVNDGSCIGTNSVTVNVLNGIQTLENAGIQNDNVICAGNEAVLFLPSGLAYAWTSVPAGFTSTASSITVTPTVTTTYNVTIAGSGCTPTTATSTISIAPSNLSVVESSGVTNDAVICSGATATINAPAGQISYQWESNPAGFTSTSPSITVTPTVNTTYTVTITNIAGCTSVATQTITVLGPGSLYVILTESSGVPNDDKICFGTSGTLEANIQTPFALNATYTWSPVTGLSASNQPVLTASPTVTTTYNVTVNAAGCILNGSKTIEVVPRPTPTIVVTENSGIASNDNNVCNGDLATLTASGGVSYQWSSNAGDATTDVVNVTPTVTTTYTVTVTGVNGCTAISNATITVPTVSPSIAVVESSGTANDGNLCKLPNATAVLNGSPASGGTYLWTSIPTGFTATTASITVTPTVSTTYNLAFTSSVNGCTANVARDIVLIDIPSTTTTITEVSGIPRDGIICQGTSAIVEVPTGAATYNWISNPAGITGNTNQVIATPNQTTTLTVTANTVGCQTTSTAVITVLPLPNTTITATRNGNPVLNGGNICLGDVLVLSSPFGGAAYSWNSSPSGVTGNTNSITVSPTQFTAYNLTITSPNLNACQNFNSFSVSVVVPPSGDITISDNSGAVANDGNICAGATATLTAPAGLGYTYNWSSVPTGFTGNTQVITPNPTVNTTYNVTITSSGCTATASKSVSVNPAPISTTTVTETSGTTANDGIICRGDNATITAAAPATGSYSYFWSSPDGFTATTQAVTVAPTVTTTYSLVLTDDATGCTSTGSRIITVNALPNNLLTVTETSGIANDAQTCYSGTGNAPSVTISVPTGASYSWVSDPSGFTGTTAAISVAPTVSTTYNVTITQNGCVNTTSQFINVSGFPTATVSASENSGTASNDGNICAGATVTLSTLAGQGAYNWSSNPVGTVGITAAINATPIITTTYSVTVTNPGGCSATGSSAITVTNTSVGNIEAAEISGVQNDGTVCAASPVVLTAMGMATGGPVTYAWTSVPAGTTGNVSVLNVSPTVTTTYLVTATPSNGSGCPATQSYTVTVLQAKAICKTATLKLNTPSVTLNIADVNNGSIGTNISIDKNSFTCFNTGVNTVKLKVTNGVCADSCNATVIISDGPGCNPIINPLAQDEAKISDPCQCTGTATNLQDGKFTETVVVDSAFTGQNWVIRKVSGLYKNAGATIPFVTGDPLTASLIGGGYSKFTLNGFHIDSIGYTIEVWRLDANGVGIPGSALTTSNRCFYPTPVYRPHLPLEVPLSSAPFAITPIDINAGNNIGATITNSGTGVVANNSFNPATAGLGTHTITTTMNYGLATSTRTGQLLDAPVCASTITQQINVTNNLPPMACKSVVNYTLERDCTAPVLAGDFLLGAPKGFGGYMVTIMDGNTVIPQVNASHVNKYLTVKVTDLTGNSCWSTMLVEDKTAPIVDCSLKKVFFCEDNVKLNLGGAPINATPVNAGVFMLPNVRECSKVDTTFYDEGVYAGCSTDSVFVGKRYFTVKDLYGNTATCAVDFEIRRRYLDDIKIPADVTLNCSDVKGGASSVTLAQSGQPTIKGKKLTDVTFCGFGATYTDAVVSTCGSSFTIQREWVVSSNCTSNTKRQMQLITIKDLDAPTVNVSSIDATINVDITSTDCSMGAIGLPIPKITDNCDANPTLNISVRNSNGNVVNIGPVLSNLGVGNYTVFYAATDNCGNVRIATRALAVRDMSAPHPVCRTNVEVSLSRTNTDVINATSLDGGSTDNCCLDVNRFEVARMNGTTIGTYAPTLQVKCSDKDMMVAFRVWDCYGNSNVCMTNVKVFDKLLPIAVPENITVTCGTDATAKIWLNDHPLKKLDKAPTSSNPGYFDHEGGDASCDVNAVVTREIDSLDNCGNGFYAYEWTVTDQSGNKIVVQQRYVSTNDSPFTVVFPKDTVIVLQGQCGIDSIGTSITYTGEANVIVPSTSCPVITKSYFDQAVKLSNDSVCYMITRVWRVSNLCKPMPATGLPLVPHVTSRDVTVNSNDINNGYFEYQQRIRVIDLAPPTITNITPVIIEPVDKECKTKVTIQLLEAKDCSNNLNQTFSLARTNGTIIPVASNTLPATIEFQAKDFGDYRVVYQVTDECGNASTASQVFNVKDVLKPTPVCHDNLSIDLGNSGLAMVQATMLDAGSFDNCSKNLKFKIRVITDSTLILVDTVKVNPDTLPTMYTFRCPPKGIPTGTAVQWKVQLWVGDDAGNWDFCETSVDVQDNMLICNYDPNEMRPLEVVVKTEKGKEIENVNVQLQGSKSAANLTSKLGKVNFTNLPSTGTYQVIPEKKTQPLNGVTTFDLVLISKHILAVQPFTTPYQFIAADVNRNGAVTTADVVELRKMILALQNDFSKNTSWRFVDQTFQFPSGVNPLSTSFPEKASIIGILPNQTVNFIGVKVGDVNANASAARSAMTSYFNADDKTVAKDEIFTATFTNQDALDGYQFTLEYDKNNLELVDIQGNKEGFGVIENGLLTVSQVLTDNSDASFSLTFKAKKAAKLSESVSMTANILSPEAYDKSGNIQNTALNFNNKLANKFELYQNQPNPFHSSTMISFSLPESGAAKLIITDISGKVVKIVKGDYAKGFNQIAIDKSDLGIGGVFYYTLESASQTATKKMIIVE